MDLVWQHILSQLSSVCEFGDNRAGFPFQSFLGLLSTNRVGPQRRRLAERGWKFHAADGLVLSLSHLAAGSVTPSSPLLRSYFAPPLCSEAHGALTHELFGWFLEHRRQPQSRCYFKFEGLVKAGRVPLHGIRELRRQSWPRCCVTSPFRYFGHLMSLWRSSEPPSEQIRSPAFGSLCPLSPLVPQRHPLARRNQGPNQTRFGKHLV